jgi:hypothetical protein
VEIFRTPFFAKSQVVTSEAAKIQGYASMTFEALEGQAVPLE